MVSMRLEDYDYASSGAYFVTICVHDRRKDFGAVSESGVILSNIGSIVRTMWMSIPNHFENVILGEFVIMPDHFHGIVVIGAEFPATVGAQHAARLQSGAQPHSLSAIIRSFKSAVTTECHRQRLEFKSQKNFFDHVIRNEADFFNTRNYIANNPRKRWLEQTP